MTLPRPKLQTSIDHLENRADPLGIPATRPKPRSTSTQKPTDKEEATPATYLGTFDSLQLTPRKRSMTFKLLDGPKLKTPYSPTVLPFLKRMKRRNYIPTFKLRSTTNAIPTGKRTWQLQDIIDLRIVDQFPIQKETFRSQNRLYQANPPLEFAVWIDNATKIYNLSGDCKLLYATDDPLELHSCIDEWLDVFWEEMIEDPEPNWIPELQQLRTSMRQRVQEVHHEQ